jgi:hypothetical protein
MNHKYLNELTVKHKKYIAIRHDSTCFDGTLSEIYDAIEDDEEPILNYKFYELGSQVEVEEKKELTLKVVE